MPKKPKPSLACENAALRRRVEMLEAVVQRLTAQPAVQIVPMPCPGPHYPAPTINPYQWPWVTAVCGASPNGPYVIDASVGRVVVNNAGCAAAPFLGTEAFQWNAGPGMIGTAS